MIQIPEIYEARFFLYCITFCVFTIANKFACETWLAKTFFERCIMATKILASL